MPSATTTSVWKRPQRKPVEPRRNVGLEHGRTHPAANWTIDMLRALDSAHFIKPAVGTATSQCREPVRDKQPYDCGAAMDKDAFRAKPCRDLAPLGGSSSHVHHHLDRSRRHRRLRVVDHHDLQRPRRHAAAGQPGLCRHRRADEAAPRPYPQPGRDREGLCRPRARHARSGGPGAQRGGHGAIRRRCRAGRGRERAERRVAAIVCAERGLSRPQGQRQFPAAAGRAHRHREQARGVAPLLQQRRAGIQHRHPAVSRRCCSPARSASRRRNSSTSASRTARCSIRRRR